MEIKKLSEAYNFYEDKGLYYLALGGIKLKSKHTARLEISGVDSSKLIISPKCGCTTSNKTIIDATTVETDVVFSPTSTGSFSKTVEIKENKKIKLIKITGTVYDN